MFDKEKQLLKEEMDEIKKIQKKLDNLEQENKEIKLMKLKTFLNKYVKSVYIDDERTGEKAIEPLSDGQLNIRNMGWGYIDRKLIVNFKEGYNIEFDIE